eukprot:TRINITY_DN25418_c0_g1_i1.p1 TRINITY_DN25418_c0_g1~~TRINITY_DN25418_c0_g1_i1.p1  ORF type:complete len:379 (-),score=79.21 TRINITY_DN25418_c0_g1_i1:1161-2228(-)
MPIPEEVLGNRDPENDASSSSTSSPDLLRKLRGLPSAITGLVRLCEGWVQARNAPLPKRPEQPEPGNVQIQVQRHLVPPPPPAQGSGTNQSIAHELGRQQGQELLMQLLGSSQVAEAAPSHDSNMPAPPAFAPPPPPAPPQLPSVQENLEETGDPTTEAGSSQLSDETSSGNEDVPDQEVEDEDEDEEDEDAARTDTSQDVENEERLLAQDKEEEDDPLANPFGRPPARPRKQKHAAKNDADAGIEKHDNQDEGEPDDDYDEEDDDDDDDDATDQEDEQNGVEAPSRTMPQDAPSPRESSRAVSSCAQAVYAVQSISRKIPRSGAQLGIEAESLIASAIKPDELAQMYEGWTSWI